MSEPGNPLISARMICLCPRAYIISENLARRHMTVDQLRKVFYNLFERSKLKNSRSR